jgi:hypothetical protein
MRITAPYQKPSPGREQLLLALHPDDIAHETGMLVLVEHPEGKDFYQLLREAAEFTKADPELVKQWALDVGYDDDEKCCKMLVENFLWVDVLRLPDSVLEKFGIKIEFYDDEVEFRGKDRGAAFEDGNARTP